MTIYRESKGPILSKQKAMEMGYMRTYSLCQLSMKAESYEAAGTGEIVLPRKTSDGMGCINRHDLEDL